MDWDEALATLDVPRLRNLIRLQASRTDLLRRGHSIDSLLVDVIWETWRRYDQYDADKAALYTWIVHIARSTIAKHQRYTRRVKPFSQLPTGLMDYLAYELPTLEEDTMRQEEIVEAHRLVDKIELAIEVLSRKRTRNTNLAVFRTYLSTLQDSGTIKASQQEVATALGTSQQNVSVAMQRIADICERCGLRL